MSIGLGVVYPRKVMAQQCDAPFSMVTKLFYPEEEHYSYSVWEEIYGSPKMAERFKSAVYFKDKGVLLVGESGELSGDAAPKELVFAQYDKRGHLDWEKKAVVSGLKDVVQMQKNHSDDGFVVLANQHKKAEKSKVWLGFFDASGRLKRQTNIADESLDLSAYALLPSLDGKGWVISVSSERVTGKGEQRYVFKNSMLYMLNEQGEVKFKRSYFLGQKTEILGLSASKINDSDTGYIATGYFENGAGKNIALVMRLDAQLSLIWQEEFSRGESAKSVASYSGKLGHVYVMTDVGASAANLDGVWLAALDQTSGKIGWQRYYYGESGVHNYGSGGIYANDDGVISVFMMARVDREKEKIVLENREPDALIAPYADFAHVLTLSPRGITLNGDSYFYGQNNEVFGMARSEMGERYLYGYSIVERGSEKEDKTPEMILNEVKPEPLSEVQRVQLPEAELSEKTKKGLALLKKKLSDKKEDYAAVETVKEEEKELDESVQFDVGGWIVVGDAPKPYNDPCK